MLRLPEEDDDPSDTSSDTIDHYGGDDGPDGSCGGVHAFVVEAAPVRKYIVVVDSGTTEHCFWRREDFSEYHPVESRHGNAAEGSKFRILITRVVRRTACFSTTRTKMKMYFEDLF